MANNVTGKKNSQLRSSQLAIFFIKPCTFGCSVYVLIERPKTEVFGYSCSQQEGFCLFGIASLQFEF